MRDGSPEPDDDADDGRGVPGVCRDHPRDDEGCLMFYALLDLLYELGGLCLSGGVVAFAFGWPVMAGPSWRSM
jgi:hypothetical protein